jgi:hypothetical protein
VRIRAFIRAHRAATAGVVAAGVAAGGFGLWWFGPQYLFIDRRVNEALPTVVAPPVPSSPQVSDPGGGEEPKEKEKATGSPAPEGPVVLAEGGFRSLEHSSSGTAVLLELPDGSRYLRLEDLDTSNGPDLIVILTDQPLSDDWNVWDDGEVLDLGPLKGNIGSSNYEIPKGTDLSRYRTAVVWCRRFRVGFAVAPLEPVR